MARGVGRRGRRRAVPVVITIFCVRPQTLNIGNDAIFLGVRHLLREAFGEIGEDFRGYLSTMSPGADNARHGDTGEGFFSQYAGTTRGFPVSCVF